MCGVHQQNGSGGSSATTFLWQLLARMGFCVELVLMMSWTRANAEFCEFLHFESH
jgi:hypothetical protein